jgi:hypothetical protein
VRFHGFPRSIVSEREIRFVGHFWRTLWKNMIAHLGFSSSYHPQTHGKTKVTNMSLGNILKRLVSEHPKQWDQALTQVEFSYNDSSNRSIGLSPF